MDVDERLSRSLRCARTAQAAEHFYLVTEPLERFTEMRPTLRVPDEEAYYKFDAGKLLLGAFEHRAKPWALDGIPSTFAFDSLPADFSHFEPIFTRAVARFPELEHAGVQLFFNGPESFTPDNRYLLGETPEVNQLFVAAGFNSIGIQSAGGGREGPRRMDDQQAPAYGSVGCRYSTGLPVSERKNISC